MSTRERVALGVVAAVAGLLLVLWLQGRRGGREAAWDADRARLVASADSARAYAADAVRWNAELLAEADRHAARSDSLAEVAAALAARGRELRWRVDTVRVPASALPYTAPRDSLIAVLGEQVDTLERALLYERRATGALREGNAVLLGTVQNLTAQVDSLSALARRAPIRRSWMPELRIGYAAGVDRTDRTLFDGPAVSLGWRLSL